MGYDVKLLERNFACDYATTRKRAITRDCLSTNKAGRSFIRPLELYSQVGSSRCPFGVCRGTHIRVGAASGTDTNKPDTELSLATSLTRHWIIVIVVVVVAVIITLLRAISGMAHRGMLFVSIKETRWSRPELQLPSHRLARFS